MSDPLHVAPGEREVVRVFALDLDTAQVKPFTTPPEGNGAAWTLQEALGADTLDPAHVETFPASDLKGVGLAGYLIEGLGIDENDIAPDRSRLEAEQGHIVIVQSAAFGGTEQTLSPKPPLRPLAAYGIAQAAPPRPATPVKGNAAPEITATAAPPPGPPARGTSLAVLMIILLAAIGLLVTVFFLRSRPY